MDGFVSIAGTFSTFTGFSEKHYYDVFVIVQSFFIFLP